jgi:clan AA aspartic protease (TIGR02281 family)
MGVNVKRLFALSCLNMKWTRRRARDRMVAITTAMVLAAVPGAAQTVCLRASDGAFVVDVVLNGTVTVRGTLDTGASDLILVCDHAARLLDLSKGPVVELQTAGGRQVAHDAKIKSVRLGAIELLDVLALIVQQTGPCRALIGVSVLKRLAGITIAGDSAPRGPQ